MNKDFLAWHAVKSSLDSSSRKTLHGYKERDVWWMSIGHNVGFEENGKNLNFSRPVLVVKGFSAEIFWGIPLTSKTKLGVYYYSFQVTNVTIQSTAILSQLKVFDTKRMISKVGMINTNDFNEIKKQLRAFLK